MVEEISGFPTLMQANAFARRYVRDSVDRCRTPGLTSREVLDAWFAFGEDADVLGDGDIAPDGAWRSAAELADFADRRGSAEERDWRALDPRREPPDEDEA